MGMVLTGVLALLLADNLRLAVHNLRFLDCDRRPCRGPDDVALAAEAEDHPSVRGRYPTYYHLARHLAGKSLTVPQEARKIARDFRRLTGMQVTVSDTPLRVDAAQVEPLRRASTSEQSWMVRGKRARGGPSFVPLFTLIDPAADEYVLAFVDWHRGPWFILSRTAYEQLRR